MIYLFNKIWFFYLHVSFFISYLVDFMILSLIWSDFDFIFGRRGYQRKMFSLFNSKWERRERSSSIDHFYHISIHQFYYLIIIFITFITLKTHFNWSSFQLITSLSLISLSLKRKFRLLQDFFFFFFHIISLSSFSFIKFEIIFISFYHHSVSYFIFLPSHFLTSFYHFLILIISLMILSLFSHFL